MLELAKSFFDQLQLEEISDLSGAFAEQARSYRVKDLADRDGGKNSDYVLKVYDPAGNKKQDSIWNTNRWTSQDFATVTHDPQSKEQPAETNEPNPDDALEALKYNWTLSEQANEQLFLPLVEIGHFDTFPYILRPFQSQTALTLINSKVSTSAPLLWNIASSLWSALAFLHQPSLNLPHGNVTAANTLLAKGPVVSTKIYLSDAVATAETERKAKKIDDIRNLGAILLQLVQSDPEPIPLFEALPRLEASIAAKSDWEPLGKEAAKWQKFIARLLDESSYQMDFQSLAAREEWLADVTPKKTTLPPIPAPVAASPAGPNLGGNAKPADTGSLLGEIDDALKAGQNLTALRLAVEGADHAPDTPEFRERIDFAASELQEEDLSNSEILILLEKGATFGSPHSALQLGLALIEIESNSQDGYSDESYAWLEKAAEHGLQKALLPMSRLQEAGTASLPSNGNAALETMEKYRATNPGPEGDYLLASLILRGRTSRPSSDAVPLLQTASQLKFYKATDLLGQCYATATGVEEIEEKKAYKYFIESWNQSKENDVVPNFPWLLNSSSNCVAKST